MFAYRRLCLFPMKNAFNGHHAKINRTDKNRPNKNEVDCSVIERNGDNHQYTIDQQNG